jgi:carboxyl-terminal processing protease
MKNQLSATVLFCKNSIILLVFSVLIFASCKKDKITAVTPIASPPPASTSSRSDLSKDSIFLYAKEVYLWNDVLPTYEVFNPRQYNASTNQLTNFNSELFAITQIKINPTTGKPYEFLAEPPASPKYSYIEDLVASGKLTFAPDESSAIGLDGQGDDLGYSLALIGTNSNYKIYFQFTSPGSPSALAGLGRGDYFDEINGRKVGTDFSSEKSFINSAINESTITIAGQKKNGTTYKVTLNKAKYISSPIYKDTILNAGSKKVGYLSYARFSSSANSVSALNNVFAKFATAGVKDLIIDLRYNGGGFVSTAQHLLNLIAPSSINTKTMFSEAYNSTMQSGAATILKNQVLKDQNGKSQFSNGRIVTYADLNYSMAANTFKFEKEGSLSDVLKVVFITSDRTASASELVINSLKPYLDVKIVGKKSYGKPVGFFPIRIDKYDVYFSLFSTTNSLGQGNYFDGFPVDAEKADDVTRDFGNPQEISTSAALSYINTGLFTTSTSSKTMSINGVSRTPESVMIKDVFEPVGFKGMIAAPPKMK